MDEAKETVAAAPPGFAVWTAAIGAKTVTLDPLELLGVLLAIDCAAVPSFLRRPLAGLTEKLLAGMDPATRDGVGLVRQRGRQYARSRFYGRSVN